MSAIRPSTTTQVFARPAQGSLTSRETFRVSCRFGIIDQGNWQTWWPLILGSGLSGTFDAGAASFVYESRDWNLGQEPYITMKYADGRGRLRLERSVVLPLGQVYEANFSYTASSRTMTMSVSANGTVLDTISHTLANDEDDGFIIDAIAIASRGVAGQWEPEATGWVDDIVLERRP